MKYTDVLDFWFSELSNEDRFNGGEKIDIEIKKRFLHLHTSVAQNEQYAWRDSAEGSLAEIIVLDQFSRNIFRGQPQAFASDAQALALAQIAIDKKMDEQLSGEQRMFLYMPFMHSESAMIHEVALRLFTSLGNEEALKYEKIHKDIIDEFNRYPYRNDILGRQSSAAEIQFLTDNKYDFFAA